jgi:hypothetical protein
MKMTEATDLEQNGKMKNDHNAMVSSFPSRGQRQLAIMAARLNRIQLSSNGYGDSLSGRHCFQGRKHYLQHG